MNTIVIEDKVRIPNGIGTLKAFRGWVCSKDFPERGRFAYLNGELWVDLSMEQPYTHNRIKTKLTSALDTLVDRLGTGEVFSDGMLLSNGAADLSTEPDAMYVSFEAIRSGRVRLVESANEGFKEIEGTPDMVLEVVSTTSVRKDTVTLRDLYWRAGISEYWIVDVRGDEPVFLVLRHTERRYVAVRPQPGGWLRSPVFGHAFRLTQQVGPLGHPQFTVEVR
jgi:Uma2 family endonuclease